MNEIVLKCLYDIQLAITETESFIEMIPDHFEEYGRHPVIKRAVERNLEIIWTILHNHLPKLKTEVAALINQAS